MKKFKYVVPKEFDGTLLQHFLIKAHGYSKRLIIDLKHGGISVNGKHLRMVDKVFEGDIVETEFSDNFTKLIPNPDLKVPIVFEDDDLIVFDKPSDMPVHPSALYYNDTLGNFFAALFEKEQIAFRPINRLDRDTTGLCISAKNTLAANKISKSLQKEYFAIVKGILNEKEGTIDLPLIRVPGSIITRKVDEGGQRAITHYKVIEEFSDYSLVSVILETGRTHQIRVHFSYIGHPLEGDTLYGGRDEFIKRQALHCGKITFSHPQTGEFTEILSPLPPDMQKLTHRD